jgi:hypothetical protein
VLTREQFIDRHFHEFCGIVLDGATAGRSGAELSLWLRTMQVRLRERLGRAWEEMAHEPAKPEPKSAVAGRVGK